jgi:hypothetical protein
MAEEHKVPSNDGIEFRGGQQIPHVKPQSPNQNQSGSSGNSNQAPQKK